MSLSVLILRLDPILLRALCAIGFVSGLAAFLLALRKQQTSSDLHPSASTSVEGTMLDPTPGPASFEPESIPQVIRLSLPSVSTRSTDMTQQEKVAAALMRAGIASPASWADSAAVTDVDAPSRSGSTAVAEPPAPVAQQRVISSQPPTPQPRFHWRRKLLLLAGSLLALASTYLFLRIH